MWRTEYNGGQSSSSPSTFSKPTHYNELSQKCKSKDESTPPCINSLLIHPAPTNFYCNHNSDDFFATKQCTSKKQHNALQVFIATVLLQQGH